jgi:hypothetical protein
MADNIPATYASPNMRWALLLYDHPGAWYTSKLVKPVDAGVPREFAGTHDLVEVTIHFPADVALAPVTATKPAVSRAKTPDDWNILVTKTLGRALKKAGYPDDMQELRALMFWRQRTAEVERLSLLPATAELPAARADETPLLQAGREQPDEVGADDAPPEDGGEGALREELRERINAMNGEEKGALSKWAKSIGVSNVLMPPSLELVKQVLEHITGISEAEVVG